MNENETKLDFWLGAGSFSPPEKTPNDLVKSLEDNDRAVRIFKRKGYITTDDWHLVTFNNFSLEYNCPDPRDVRKKDWKEKAQENLDAVAEYLSKNTFIAELKLDFQGIDAYKCAIFDATKYTRKDMCEKLHDIFDEEE